MICQKDYNDTSGRKVVTTWTCTLCNYQSKYRHVCLEHMYGRHGDPENLTCEYCGKYYAKRTSLRVHKFNKCPLRPNKDSKAPKQKSNYPQV